MHHRRQNGILLWFCCVAVVLCLVPRSGTDKNSEPEPGPLAADSDKTVRRHDTRAQLRYGVYNSPLVVGRYDDCSNSDSRTRDLRHRPHESAIALRCQDNPLLRDLEKCKDILEEASLNAAQNRPFSSSMIGLLDYCRRVIGNIVERTREDNDGVEDGYHEHRLIDQGSVHGSHHFQAVQRRDPTPHAGPKSVANWSENQGAKNTHGRRELCEEAVCQIRDLEKQCETANDHASKDSKEACEMCYPRKDTTLVNAHCSSRRSKETKAFYVVGIFFIAVSLCSGLAIFLRNRNRDRRRRSKQKALRSDPDTPGLSTQISWFGNRNGNSNFDHDRQAEDDDAESNSIEKNWTVQPHRWQQKLGLFSRSGPRKRIQDLFDLESLKPSRKDALGDRHLDPENAGAERIPVLPRAPNASIRLSRTNSKSSLKRSHSHSHSSCMNVNDLTGQLAKSHSSETEETTANTATLPEIRVQQVNSNSQKTSSN